MTVTKQLRMSTQVLNSITHSAIMSQRWKLEIKEQTIDWKSKGYSLTSLWNVDDNWELIFAKGKFKTKQAAQCVQITTSILLLFFFSAIL